MSSTLNRVLYGLRTAKNIERKMMCEVFGRLGQMVPLNRYRYVGMGGLGFHDHALFHQRLGIRDMISVEKNVVWKDRVRLNRPYKCIAMEWGLTSERLPSLSWRKPAIVWLDYDDPLDSSMLDDIHLVTANAMSGSVVVVTVNAHPDQCDSVLEAPGHRMKQLVSRVGEDRLPLGTRGRDLAQWGLAAVSRSIIVNEIMDALDQRNGPLTQEQRLAFSQFFHFRYADTSKMVTVGGLLATDCDRRRFEKVGVGELDFVRTGSEALELEIPKLTLREIRYLNQRLPTAPSALRHLKSIPAEHVERYSRLYRYFPAFTEIETAL